MIFDKFKAYAAGAAALALGAVAVVQTVRLHGEQLAHQKLIALNAQAAERRAEQGRVEDNKTADKDAAHAASTQRNSDAFTQTQPARDADRRADLDRLARVQLAAERREATYRAQAQADAAARSHLADRLAAFDRQLVEGVRVVGDLRTDLARRDAEVLLLHSQVLAERGVNVD